MIHCAVGLVLVTRSRLLGDKANKTNDFGINNVICFENYTENMCLFLWIGTRYGITHFDSFLNEDIVKTSNNKKNTHTHAKYTQMLNACLSLVWFGLVSS